MSSPWNAAHCTTCAQTGRRGYCAPAGCYCGHETCHAYPSWVAAKRSTPVTVIPTAKSRAAEAWADREEPTWLDR